MDKKTAISKIESIGGTLQEKARATALINNPTLVDQSCFGVCGMASIIYCALKFNLERFVDVYRTVYAAAPFSVIVEKTKSTVKTCSVSVPGLKVKLENEYARKKLARTTGVNKAYVNSWNDDSKVDFFVSRALAYIIESLPNEFGTGIINMQKAFSRLFDGWNEGIQGDLAVDEECIDIMLGALMGATDIQVVQHLGMNMDKAFTKINKYFTDHPTASVLVAINGAGGQNGLVNSTGVIRHAFVNTGGSRAEFTHWMVIRGKVTITGSTYKIPFWTWARDWDIEIAKTVAPSYLYSFIMGAL